MELNTNLYIKYKSKIDEYWQDQVDAGTWGRANLEEVSRSFANLKERIINDTNLPQDYKDELLGIIREKVEQLKAREKEILKAEDEYTKEKEIARERVSDRFKGLPYSQQEKYYWLKSILLHKGYDIFLTVEEMDSLFKGEEEYSEMKNRLRQESPIIAKDFIPEIEKTEKRLNQVREEK